MVEPMSHWALVEFPEEVDDLQEVWLAMASGDSLRPQAGLCFSREEAEEKVAKMNMYIPGYMKVVWPFVRK